MKAQNLVLMLVVVIMLASLGGTYLLFSQQGALSTQKIDALKMEINNLGVVLKKVDTGYKDIEVRSMGYADSIKSLEDKIAVFDTDRASMAAKVNDLARAVEDIKVAVKSAEEAKQAVTETSMSMAAPASYDASIIKQTEVVDLGQIPVQK